MYQRIEAARITNYGVVATLTESTLRYDHVVERIDLSRKTKISANIESTPWRLDLTMTSTKEDPSIPTEVKPDTTSTSGSKKRE